MPNKPKCVVPGCTSSISSTNRFDMCFRHADFTRFLVWMLPQILDIKPKQVEQKQEEKKEVNPLWTPNSGPSGMIR